MHYLEKMAGVSDQDAELSRLARDSFHSHRYEGCLSALNKLLDFRRYDGRVIHNRAVAQYMLSNQTHTDEFRRTLQSVSAQVSGNTPALSTIHTVHVCSLTMMLRLLVKQYWSAIKQCCSTTELSYT